MSKYSDEYETINPLAVGSVLLEFASKRDKKAYFASEISLPFYAKPFYSSALSQVSSDGLFQPRAAESELVSVEVFTKAQAKKYIGKMIDAFEKRKSYIKNRTKEYAGDSLFGTGVIVYLDCGIRALSDKRLYPNIVDLLQDGRSVGIFVVLMATAKEGKEIGEPLVKAAHLSALLNFGDKETLGEEPRKENA